MPNQYSALTAENIHRKVNRKRNPVKSITQLAEEFGRDTSYYRYGKVNTRPPSSFVKEVKALIGEAEYNTIRQSNHVPLAYR